MNSQDRTRLEDASYRRDIDGLRAVAIVSVLGFHAAGRFVPGGFIGVDVFFVISGYLITGIIVKALARGTFTFSDFYARRIRRIFPALLIMLVTVLAVGWLKLFPDEYQGLAKHIAAGSAYVSNFLLYRESGYFDTTAELKPLLHLWSLGVEEQFYILWPMLLVLTWKIRRAQLPVMAAIACASFALNVALVRSHPVATFYLPQARLWELAVGGILAHLQLSGKMPQQSRAGRALLAVIGLLLLGVSIGALDKYQLFPGWWALGPTVGTLLLIAAGEDGWVNRRLLGNRPMVFIGQISYPLYLWHWPLLSFMRIIEADDATPTATLLAVTIALILATLTYRFIEMPVRNLRPATRPAVPLFVGAAIVGACGLAIFEQRLAPLSARFGVERILRATTESAYPGPHLKPLSTQANALLRQQAGTTGALFIGDSNIEQYYPRVDRVLNRDPNNSRSVTFATNGGCPPIPGVREAHHPYCDGLVARAMAYAHDPGVDTVVIGAAWQSYFSDPDPRYEYYYEDNGFKGALRFGSAAEQRALGAFEAMVSGFSRQGKRVFIILQIPVGDAMDPHGMIERGFGQVGFSIHSRPLNRQEVSAQIAPIDSKLVEIARRQGATVIDPLNALCGVTLCPTVDGNGEPIYRDGGHIRPSYVRERVSFLDDVLTLRHTVCASPTGC